MRLLRRGGSDLAAYLCSSFHHAPRGDAPSSRCLFPMPPPYGWGLGEPPRGAAARRAWYFDAAVRILVNLVVIILSQLSSPSPRRCPSWARAGSLVTTEQADAVQRIEDLCRQYADTHAPASDRAFRTDLLVERAVRLGGARIFSAEPSSTSPPLWCASSEMKLAVQPNS